MLNRYAIDKVRDKEFYIKDTQNDKMYYHRLEGKVCNHDDVIKKYGTGQGYYFETRKAAQEVLQRLMNPTKPVESYDILIDGVSVYRSQIRPKTVQVQCQRTVTVTIDDVL